MLLQPCLLTLLLGQSPELGGRNAQRSFQSMLGPPGQVQFCCPFSGHWLRVLGRGNGRVLASTQSSGLCSCFPTGFKLSSWYFIGHFQEHPSEECLYDTPVFPVLLISTVMSGCKSFFISVTYNPRPGALSHNPPWHTTYWNFICCHCIEPVKMAFVHLSVFTICITILFENCKNSRALVCVYLCDSFNFSCLLGFG